MSIRKQSIDFPEFSLPVIDLPSNKREGGNSSVLNDNIEQNHNQVTINSFTQQIFIEALPCAQQCAEDVIRSKM